MKEFSYRKYSALMKKIALDHNIPVNGSFELTPLCNLDCKMCYVHEQDVSVKDRILTGDQWISIMQQAVDAGMMLAMLTGGEAMTHPDFWRIYMFLASQGVRTSVKTNGILLTEEAIKRFIEYPPTTVDISLYGCNSEAYLAVTGRDVFETVEKNIRNAVKAGLNVRIMITPSKHMLPWIEQITELAESFGTQVKVNSLLIDARESTGRSIDEFNMTLEEYRKINVLRDEKFPVEFISKEEEEDLVAYRKSIGYLETKNGNGLACSGGKNSFAINWDGVMVPCLSFPREIASANISEMSFIDAWNTVVKQVSKYRIPAECISCKYFEKCNYCPVQHSNLSLQRKCSPDVCSYWHTVFETREKMKND